MTITKKDCLEFLQTHKVNGQKNEHVYGLFVLVEKLGGKWPSYNDMFLNGDFPQLSARAENRILKAIEGYTGREFGRMVYAKNEIKRRDDAIKEWEKSNTISMFDHINAMQTLSRCPSLRGRCIRVPIIDSSTQSEFHSKALAQKVSGGKVAGSDIFKDAAKVSTGYEEAINHIIKIDALVGVDRDLFIKRFNGLPKDKKEVFLNLKAEQEEKQMKGRDSNAQLKEGGRAIVSNEQGFIMHYGAELIGHEVEIVKFFNHTNIDLAAVEFDGSVYCFRKSMLEPVKTERQKAIQFYLGQVSLGMNGSVFKANEKYYGFAIETLIDSGYLNTKVPPIAR